MANIIDVINAVNNNKVVLLEVCDWHANGYDDSDWDTIYFNVNDKSIVHNFGTTRGYCESSLPNNSETFKWKLGVDAGIATEAEIREAFINDVFKDGRRPAFSLYDICHLDFKSYLPVISDATRGLKGNGIMLYATCVCGRDYFGRETETYRAYCFDPSKNRIVKIPFYHISLQEGVADKIIDNFMNNATIPQIAAYVSHRNSCSRFSSSWASEDILKFAKDLFEAPDMSTAVDATSPKPSTKSKKYLKAKEKIADCQIRYRAWVETLDETPEKRDEIFDRTMRKYCGKELDYVATAEADK